MFQGPQPHVLVSKIYHMLCHTSQPLSFNICFNTLHDESFFLLITFGCPSVHIRYLSLLNSLAIYV